MTRMLAAATWFVLGLALVARPIDSRDTEPAWLTEICAETHCAHR